MSSETNFSWSGPKSKSGEKWAATSKRLKYWNRVNSRFSQVQPCGKNPNKPFLHFLQINLVLCKICTFLMQLKQAFEWKIKIFPSFHSKIYREELLFLLHCLVKDCHCQQHRSDFLLKEICSGSVFQMQFLCCI